jgi:hypothetical protein
LLLLAACGKSAEQRQAEDAMRQLQKAGEQLGQAAAAAAGAATTAAGALATGRASEPVDFRALRDLLPEELPGLKRTSIEGEKTGAMGFNVSQAEARYESEEGANLTLKIIDLGAVSGVAAMASYAWATVEVDRENQDGYERTFSQGGYRGYERYDRSNRSGEVSLLVAGRFVVEANGYNISAEALKEALEKVNAGALEGMKDAGVK